MRKPEEDIAKWVKRWNLRRLMDERNISPEGLSELYGCSKEYIYQLLRGDVGIGKESMKKLSEVLEIMPTEFMKSPPELGSPEFDEVYKKLLHVSKDAENLNILKEIIDLLLKASHEQRSDEIVEILKGQLVLFRKIISS